MSVYKLAPLQLHENARCAKCGEKSFHIDVRYDYGNVDDVFEVYCYECEEECELTADPIEGKTMETEDGFNKPLQFTNEQELAFLRAVDYAVDYAFEHAPELLKAHPSFFSRARFEIFQIVCCSNFRDIPRAVEAKLPPFDVHAMEQMVARGYPTAKQGKEEYYKLLNLEIDCRWRNAMEIQRIWRGHDARWKCPCFTWWKDEDERKPKKARSV